MSNQMQAIEQALSLLKGASDCSLFPPEGMPRVDPGVFLPQDLQAFYAVAGGASLFQGSTYQFSIVAPSAFLSINSLIIGEAISNDISASWFSIAEDGNGDYLSIDLHPRRLGRCYDSFHETHGLIGSTPVIARSFTELLLRLIENRGGYPYWLSGGFVSLGDAYDGVEQGAA